jgi:hypothetical protein
MGGYIVIGGLILVIGIYILSYYLNGKTDAPAGVNPIECESCHSLSCSVRGNKKEITPEECAINQLD